MSYSAPRYVFMLFCMLGQTTNPAGPLFSMLQMVVHGKAPRSPRVVAALHAGAEPTVRMGQHVVHVAPVASVLQRHCTSPRPAEISTPQSGMSAEIEFTAGCGEQKMT